MIDKFFLQRKYYWLFAVMLFVAELALCIWPVGWLKEDLRHYLEGYGRYTPELAGAPREYYQEFRPDYSNLTSLEFLFEDQGQEFVGEGYVLLQILSEEGEVLFEEQLPDTEIVYGRYIEIPVDVKLSLRENYTIRISCVPDHEGRLVTMGLGSREEIIPENGSLLVGDSAEEWPDSQLLTGYHYKGVIERDTLWKMLFLAVITLVGIGVGVPDKRALKILLGVALMLAAPWVLGQRLEGFSLFANALLPHAMKWNMMIMFLLSVVIFLCTLSLRWSIVLTYMTLGVVYTANYFVNIYRGAPLKINDFAVVGTAAEVVGDFDLTPNKHITIAWCILIVVVVYGWQCGGLFSLRRAIKEKLFAGIVARAAAFVAGCALLGGMAYTLLYTDTITEHGFIKLAGVSQQMMYQYNGYLVSTCIDIQGSRVSMMKPEGYSQERVRELLAEAGSEQPETAVGEEELPHVILIMNESYCDLRDLGNLEISEENMSFFYGLAENTIRGKANVSVLGGGTANSEFEVFTGCTLGFLPNSYYGYQQGMYKERNSLISLMEDAGYDTYSIHPENSRNWNRNVVYNYFGFDRSYWVEDFEGAEVVHNGVSDRETYRKVQEVYEGLEQDERMFVFNLTMQNHGGYTETNIEPEVFATNVESSEADVYLSLIKESDRAFEELVHYFEAVDDKVIICMYGDHQPSFSNSEFRDGVYAQTADITSEERVLNQYVVPFVIWANYDIPEETDYDISLNYLGALLAKTAGAPLNPYFTFLNNYMEKYPMITTNGYKDADGNYYSWSGQNDELIDYRVLQYNYMFDEDIVTDQYN